ncbi:hypothetical protein NPIL_498161 [Nephila pilipes]|uniref:Uncharacterized protein n=1 Tax=Nephila pilipes TaxID=299642 RepID=A0A8X6IG91_NEPPI|nr:hypothetical protein NPIL_498161 [Nephila pilipes]
MWRLRTTRPFIQSQTGCGRGFGHQNCLGVINGVDGKMQNRAHALGSQLTMTFLTVTEGTRAKVTLKDELEIENILM